jgi:hypothetical protein
MARPYAPPKVYVPIPVTCLADRIYNDLVFETYHRIKLSALPKIYSGSTREEIDRAVRQLVRLGKARIPRMGGYIVRKFPQPVYPCKQCQMKGAAGR